MLLCNDVERLGPGKSQYSMALNTAGGVIDDIILWRFPDGRLWILPNGANHERIMASFTETAPEAAAFDLRPETVSLAVQGPSAPSVLEAVVGVVPKRRQVATATFSSRTVVVAGTGYTGEAGGEVVAPVEIAEPLLRSLLHAGAVPCGLGARDTLRLEAGLPLWGQDLDEAITPLEADLGFAIDWDHDFVGKPALERQRDEGLPKKRVAFRTEGRLVPRHGYALRSPNSTGEVTSGNFSPVLERGIGMGFLAPADDQGPVEVEIRNIWHSVERVTPPFID
jgi:aminomethyltransferase